MLEELLLLAAGATGALLVEHLFLKKARAEEPRLLNELKKFESDVDERRRIEAELNRLKKL